MSHDSHAPTTITETVTVQTTVDDPAGTAVPRQTSLVAVAGAELFGTFLFVFVGLGAALYASTQGLSTFEVALAYGVALMGALAAVGHVSGGHFNPAVTLGATLAGRTSWRRLPVYWLSQVVGAVAGAAVLFAAIPSSFASESSAYATLRDFFSTTANGTGIHSGAYRAAEAAFYAPYLAQGITRDQVDEAIAGGQLAAPSLPSFGTLEVVIFEVVLTALFVGIFLAVTDRRFRSKMAPVVLGLSFAALLVVATPMSNGSLNPARSIAAAVFSDGWAFSHLWVFLVAPLAGGALAALFYRGFASGPTALSTAVAAGMHDEIAVEDEASDAQARDELFDRTTAPAVATDAATTTDAAPAATTAAAPTESPAEATSPAVSTQKFAPAAAPNSTAGTAGRAGGAGAATEPTHAEKATDATPDEAVTTDADAVKPTEATEAKPTAKPGTASDTSSDKKPGSKG